MNAIKDFYGVPPNLITEAINDLIVDINFVVGSILTIPFAGYFYGANLSTAAEGSTAYVIDGFKVGESGTGTGVPVYYSNGYWRTFSNDEPVQYGGVTNDSLILNQGGNLNLQSGGILWLKN